MPIGICNRLFFKIKIIRPESTALGDRSIPLLAVRPAKLFFLSL